MTYHGSRLFSFVSESTGLPIDQVKIYSNYWIKIILIMNNKFLKLNFLLSQIFAIIFGLCFRSFLKPCPQNTRIRHLVGFLVGILLGYFCYGGQMWHSFLQSFVCYLALQFCPRRYVHLLV